MKIFVLFVLVVFSSGCKKCITITDVNGQALCEKCFVTTQQQIKWSESHYGETSEEMCR